LLCRIVTLLVFYTSQTLAREGSEALPSTLPEGEIITEGLYIVMPASEVMRE
jgi:hypothetical protein